jgi:hypothetical protein
MRGMNVTDLDTDRPVERKVDLRLDWVRRLCYLVKPISEIDFEYAWAVAVGCLSQAQGSLRDV